MRCCLSMPVQFQLLLHLQFDFPMNVPSLLHILHYKKQKNLTHKCNSVNVLLLLNASAILIAPLHSIWQACEWWIFFHFPLFAQNIKISPPDPMRSMSHWFSMLQQSSSLLLLQFYWPGNVECLFFLTFIQTLKNSPPTLMWSMPCCFSMLLQFQLILHWSTNGKLLINYVPSFSHCLRKILGKISPANTMRSMCCWSSLLLRCQLLLYWQLDCSVNVSIKSPFSNCF